MRQLHSRGFLADTEKPNRNWLQEYIPPDEQPHVTEAIHEAIRIKGIFELEHRVRRSDGTLGWTSSRAVPLMDANGEIIEWFGAASDITERKRSEQALRELNETLEQRVAERTKLAEDRAGQLSRLTSELALTEERERRRLADILHEHLQQLLVGVRLNLDALSGHVALDRKPVLDAARKLLADTIQTSRSITSELSPPILYQNGLVAGLEWLARWKQEKFGFSVELQAEPEVIALKEDMMVVLFRSVRELLFNAIKHSGVDSAKVILSKDGPDRLRIAVCDSGKGFDPTRIWESSRQQSGFGLFTIRERLEFSGGRLEIESAPGKGAALTLIAPVERAKVRKSAAIPETISSKPSEKKDHKFRTLLVDDHAVVRHGLSMILDTQEDIEVVGEAADGEEAVKLARKMKPDVIIMDISLPGIDGIEATRRIHLQMSGIRIICLSMFEDHEMASSAFNAGAAAYLTKSGDTDNLLSAIRGEGVCCERQS